MKVNRVVYISVLVNGISAAAIQDPNFARDVGLVHLEARASMFDSLLGSLVSWLTGGDSAEAADTQTAATTAATAAPAAATPAADTLAATAAATAATTTAATEATTSSDDGWWFPPFTWPGKSTTAVAGSATSTGAAATYTPTTLSSAYVPASSTQSQSTSTSTGSSGGSSGGTDVESISEKSGGIAYSPYTKGGQCKSQLQVAHDMQVLSAYSIIRLYGVDCNGVDNTLASIGSNQKLFVGIYNIDSNSINTDLGTLKTAVEGSKRGWGAIDTVSIGNELVNFGKANPLQISSAIQTAKSWFKQNASSYSGSIVSVDTLVAVLNNPDLCDASDYLAVNSHPFWDGNVQPEDSGSFLQSQISQLKSTCNNNKKILITESGWPTQGDSYGSCVPSVANQLTAVKSIVNALGDDVLMFTTYNDYWKDGGSYGVEKYWGIYGDPAA